jgi:hypothetical protein
MTIDLSVLTPDTRNWAQSTSTASVTPTDTDRTLTGTAAAAYLFGETLKTVKFDYSADGLQLTDGRFEFPPDSGQPVSLAEVADALRYKYGVDPLIEFAPGLGLRGYSVADINRILEALNREFADEFSLAPIPLDDTVGTLPATPASFTVASTATDTTAESVIFLNDPDWKSGTPVRVSTTGGGLTAGENYFVRNLTGGKYEFYTNQTEAASGTGTTTRVNLTATLATTVLPRTYSPTTATDTTADTVTFVTDPGWTSGMPVRVSSTGGGLTAGVDYFVRNLTGGKYAFYTNQAAASGGTSGRVNLTADVSETVVPLSYGGLIDKDDGIDGTIQMTPPPGWATGTKVRVSANGGGLTAGVDYFVRDLTGGKYEFYTSQVAASAALTANRVNLNSNITKEITPSPSSATVDGDWVTFSDNPQWATGTRVQASTTGGGLTAGVDYFVRALSDDKYALFTDQTADEVTGTAGQVPLTANNIAMTLTPSPISATVDDDWVTFASNPNWVTGTPVQVSTTGGGLTAGTVYFVRSLGSGRYDFFTSQGAALGTSNAGVRVNLTGPISAVSPSYGTAALDIVLNTASTPILAPATESELRQSLTEGGDLYTDRFGAFYLNGVRTQAMDVAVTSRLLVQDNVSAEYKTLMDELAERNNLIAAARTVLSGGESGLQSAVSSLAEQYGMADVLSELTAGQFLDTTTTSVYRPASTSVTATPAAGKVVFASESDPAWASGTRVRAAATGGGLTAGVNYFVRSLGAGQYSFFSSETEAKASTSNQISTGQIAITGPISDLMIPTVTVAPASTSAAFVPSRTRSGGDNSVEFLSDPGWPTGTQVRVNQSGQGLNAGSDYFVSRDTSITPVRYRFYTSSALSNQVDLTGDVTAYIYAAPTPSVTFTADPGWPNGTRVQASATGGGLTAGTDYFVRKIGTGQYSFFDTAPNAKATSATTGLVILSEPITASITNPNPSADDFTAITALLNTLISNKVRDGDLDQAKLQTLTAQLQNNTEAMTALIKAFTDMNAQLARAL